MDLDHKDQSLNGDLTMNHKKILTRRWCFGSAQELLGHKPVASMVSPRSPEMAVENLSVYRGRVHKGSSKNAISIMSLSYPRTMLAWCQMEAGVQACTFPFS